MFSESISFNNNCSAKEDLKFTQILESNQMVVSHLCPNGAVFPIFTNWVIFFFIKVARKKTFIPSSYIFFHNQSLFFTRFSHLQFRRERAWLQQCLKSFSPLVNRTHFFAFNLMVHLAITEILSGPRACSPILIWCHVVLCVSCLYLHWNPRSGSLCHI